MGDQSNAIGDQQQKSNSRTPTPVIDAKASTPATTASIKSAISIAASIPEENNVDDSSNHQSSIGHTNAYHQINNIIKQVNSEKLPNLLDRLKLIDITIYKELKQNHSTLSKKCARSESEYEKLKNQFEIINKNLRIAQKDVMAMQQERKMIEDRARKEVSKEMVKFLLIISN